MKKVCGKLEIFQGARLRMINGTVRKRGAIRRISQTGHSNNALSSKFMASLLLKPTTRNG